MVRLNDFFNIFRFDEAVPNRLEIDDDCWAMHTLVETPRFVAPDVCPGPSSVHRAFSASRTETESLSLQHPRGWPGVRSLVQTKTWRSNIANLWLSRLLLDARDRTVKDHSA